MSQNNPKGKTGKILLLIVLVILLVGAGVFVGLKWNNWFGEDTQQGGGLTTDENAQDWTGEQDVYEYLLLPHDAAAVRQHAVMAVRPHRAGEGNL